MDHSGSTVDSTYVLKYMERTRLIQDAYDDDVVDYSNCFLFVWLAGWLFSIFLIVAQTKKMCSALGRQAVRQSLMRRQKLPSFQMFYPSFQFPLFFFCLLLRLSIVSQGYSSLLQDHDVVTPQKLCFGVVSFSSHLHQAKSTYYLHTNKKTEDRKVVVLA
jgi:hypothetical protein